MVFIIYYDYLALTYEFIFRIYIKRYFSSWNVVEIIMQLSLILKITTKFIHLK